MTGLLFDHTPFSAPGITRISTSESMKVTLRRSTLQILKRLGNMNSVKKMLNIYILWACKMSYVIFRQATVVKARGEKTERIAPTVDKYKGKNVPKFYQLPNRGFVCRIGKGSH